MKSIYVLAVLATAVILGGCATATPINTGSGQQAYLIECPGSGNSMSNCVKKANSVCPTGYNIAGSREQAQGSGSVIYNPALQTMSVVQNVSRNLVVQCK